MFFCATQPPQPYAFSYDNTDEFGTRLTRDESSDANNNRVGSYSYSDAAGLTRTVKYTADAGGFHATVETNEPGTKTSTPADALYSSSSVEVGPAPVVAKPVTVHAVQAVHATPVHTVATHPVTYGVPHPFAYTGVPHPFAYTGVRPVGYAVHPAPFTYAKSA
ncbi:hypothetical protein HPB48_007363 [Haemaphysalis longicornis]|uniref:Cuticle protein n=1 Tax=Haemaphysalis longicornis TaxID=44386 RepID=A0A9J6G783_HAELO|nr:hypothetical protein HPB48_007363 [Haemaphysalis longicornis]